MVPLGLPEQGKRQSWRSSGLGLLVTSSLAERFCSSWCCQLRRRGGQMWTTADVWASQCGCAQMLWHHPASAAVTVTSLITARGMILWKPCRSKLVSAGWKLPTVSLLGWEIHEDFKWTLVLLGLEKWDAACRIEKWELLLSIILCVILVFRTYSSIEFTYWKLEVNALDVDIGSEWDGRGQERPKLFLLFTENRLNVIWPLHLNG